MYGFHAPGVREGIEAANTHGDVKVVHWIGAGDTNRFDEDIVQWHLGEFAEYPEFELPEGLFRRVQALCEANLFTAVDQLSRNPALIGSTLADYRSFFQMLVRRFTKLLVGKKVDLVFFQNLPHEGIEYVLYAVACALRISTVMTYQSVLPNRFFYCRTLEDFGRFYSADPKTVTQRIALERKFEKKLFYIEQPATGEVAGWRNTLKRVRERAKISIRDFGKTVKAKTGYDRLKNKTNRPEHPGEDYIRLLTLHSKSTIDFTRQYVYFPLHLQPELTTSAIGDQYTDQMLALERLRSFLPEQWWIYVKENPKQTHKQRDSGFFERLSKLPRTILVDRKVNTYQLLRHCEFAATITGTVGWEAVTGGKCALVFGRPWYLSLPGVFHINCCPDALTIANTHYSNTQLQFEFDRLYALSRSGLVDIAYRRSLGKFNAGANAELISEFVTEMSDGERLKRCA